MKEAKAKRLRFAILTARSRIFPERLTENQIQFLAAISPDEIMIGDFGTTRAHDREYIKQYEKYRSAE